MENFDNEQWRDIDGYDGMYQVSDLGRVRSKHSGEWKVLKGIKDKDGYLRLSLFKYGKRNKFFVHRLVASAFIPNDDSSKTIINHRNECKSDNRASNLEWCDYRYNNTYNDIHHRHITKRTKVKDLYDPNLTYEQNLEIFKANGVECSRDIIKCLRRDLNLEPHPNYKRHKLKDLYDPNLTYKQNIAIFNENGVECSISTFYRLRKDINK